MSKFFKYTAAASVLALMSASAVYAQETTGGIKGTVTDEQGAAVAGATVTVVQTSTGITQTTITDKTGYFVVSQLRVGGPYTVTITATGFDQADAQVPYVNIGEPTESDVTLKAGGAVQEVVVKGKRRETVSGRTSVGAKQIATFPTLNRDIRDFALKAPTAYMDPTNSNALSLGGMNNRSNAILVDGVRAGDDFGLNANGMPTQRSMVSPDSIEAVNVDIVPYDVQYSFFQGGVINLVTKSGTNDFHGTAFYEYTNDDLRGDKFVSKNTAGVKATTFVPRTVDEKTYGYSLSGPIIKDRLFFFGLYEKYESGAAVEFGPSDSSASRPIPGVSQAEVDQITNILKTKYNYDPLGWAGGSAPITDEKIQTKFDWQINDNHRAVFAYTDTKSGRVTDTGNSTSATTGSLGLMSKWYTLQSNMKIYKGQLISRWTDHLSTEMNFSRKEVVNISTPMGGTDFAEFRIYVADSATTNGPSVYAGPDVSRQANVLTNNVDHFDLKAKYRWNNHLITVGGEYEKVDIFNLFVQAATGQYVFRSIAELDAKQAFSVTYRNAGSNVKDDGGASFSYTTASLYAQDQWRVTPRLTVSAGLRYDSYQSDDLPKANPLFQSRYGFTNATGLDGLSIWQPRVSFNWRPSIDDTLTIYGGVGKFQGGSANVWVSNGYTNTGNLLGSFSCTRSTSATPTAPQTACNNALNNTDGFNVNPYFQAQNTASANAGTGDVNALAPDFEMPSVWKSSIGAQKVFGLAGLGDNYRLNVEFVHAKFAAQAYWRDLYQEKAYSGTAPDGRPEYFGKVDGAARANRADIVMYTAEGGRSDTFSVALSKAWNEGWAQGLSVDASVAINHADEINPGTSSTAASNFRGIYTTDPSKPLEGTSVYQIDRISKATLNYERRFFGNNATRITLYAQSRTGPRFSYAFQDVTSSFAGSTNGASVGMFGEQAGTAGFNRQLLYVPMTDASGNVTATSDPIVKYASTFDVTAFNTFLKSSGLIGYAGKVAPRNGFKANSSFLANLHIEQEVPAFFPSRSKLILYFDLQNLGNAINDEAGVYTKYNFSERTVISARNCQPAAVAANNGGAAATANRNCAAGTGNFYQYDSLNLGTKFDDFNTSVYQIKVGVRYRF